MCTLFSTWAIFKCVFFFLRTTSILVWVPVTGNFAYHCEVFFWGGGGVETSWCLLSSFFVFVLFVRQTLQTFLKLSVRGVHQYNSFQVTAEHWTNLLKTKMLEMQTMEKTKLGFWNSLCLLVSWHNRCCMLESLFFFFFLTFRLCHLSLLSSYSCL